MVSNFHEGFIFVFFASQEPFVKMKPQNFCCSHGKRTHRVSIPGLLGTIYVAANRSNSVSVPSTAITEAIQEIEVLCKHRCMNQTAVQHREWKQLFL